MISALNKRTLSGERYKRDGRIEALLVELAGLSRDELLIRAAISRRDHPDYVPSECLVYFVRASRHDNSNAWFERLYSILIERVLRCLPRAKAGDGQSEPLTQITIREKVFDRFVGLLAADRETIEPRLDFFECRFDGAIANMRRDAQEQAWREEKRHLSLAFDEDTGELSPEVETAMGPSFPIASHEFDKADDRLRLEAAIDALPPEQIRIIEMLRQGFPIDSNDPEAITIAKMLGRSEKTVRLWRDKAYASLRTAMSAEDKR